MNNRFRTAVAVSLLALACSGSAFAQSSTYVPIVNNKSGKVEAFLQLDPVSVGGKRAQWRFGSNSLDSAFGLGNGESLALLCDTGGTTPQSIRNLSSGCMLGSLDRSGRRGVGASVQKGSNHVGFNLGKGNSGLPEWLTPVNGKVQQTDIALYAERNVGRTGVVSIAGTTASARLVPAAEMPLLADRWNTQSLSVGGGVGNIRANIFGRVVSVPGQPKFEGFGLGVTWRTPWSGQLSVGAENIVTKGSNPFAVPGKDGKEDSAVPYVRYQQDL